MRIAPDVNTVGEEIDQLLCLVVKGRVERCGDENLGWPRRRLGRE